MKSIPNIVLLAGGRWQIPIVQYMKTKGQVCVVNPAETEATKLADFHVKENVKDVNKIAKQINPIFITTDQSDVAVMPTARLSHFFGTKGNNIDSIKLFTDKLSMSQFSKRVPECKTVNNVKDIINFGFPCVIKPTDANASRGFWKLDDDKNLKQKLDHSRTFSSKVIVQRYVKGEMFVLDGICSGNRHRTLTLARKTHFRDGMASSLIYDPKCHVERLIAFNDRYVESSGLEFGITHAEYMVNDDFWLLEIAARGGGFGISSDIVPWVTGIDVYDILYRSLMGEVVDVNSLKIKTRAARLQFFEYSSGKVISIEGLEDVKQLPFVKNAEVWVKEGQVIRPARDGSERHAFVLLLADTNEQIENYLKEVRRLLKVETNEE